MMIVLLKIILYVYFTCAGIACLTGFLNKWFNTHDVFYFFARLTIGLIFIMTAWLIVAMIIGAVQIW